MELAASQLGWADTGKGNPKSALLDCAPSKAEPKSQSCTLEEVIFSVHVWIVSDDVERGPPRHHLEHQHPQRPPVHAEPCKAHTAHSFHLPSHTNQHWWPGLSAGITDLHHHCMSLSLLNWDDKWKELRCLQAAKLQSKCFLINIFQAKYDLKEAEISDWKRKKPLCFRKKLNCTSTQVLLYINTEMCQLKN